MQSLSFLRRLAILLVALGIIINAGLYYLASQSLKKEKIVKFYNVIIILQKEDMAKKLADQLKQENYQTRIYSESQLKSKLIGFAATQDFLRTKSFESVKKMLTMEGFNPKEIAHSDPERFKLQIGPVFESKSQAQVLVNNIRQKGVVFIVEPIYEKKPFVIWCVRIEKLDKAKAEKVKANLEKKITIEKDIKLAPYSDRRK